MELVEVLVKAIDRAATELPPGMINLLETARDRSIEPARTQLETMLENLRLASKLQRPICQDTGTPSFFVRLGSDYGKIAEIRPAIVRAVKIATEVVPLRPNAVDPLTGKNSADNSGYNLPLINWEVVPGTGCTIDLLLKGGGAENCSRLAMLTPTEGLPAAVNFIVDSVVSAGGKPCPPLVVGAALGGGADKAMGLAKQALLRPVAEKNSNPELARLESTILDKINHRGAGPMGLGGGPTALAVQIEVAARHPASFPVGLVIQCWAHRCCRVELTDNGSFRVRVR